MRKSGLQSGRCGYWHQSLGSCNIESRISGVWEAIRVQISKGARLWKNIFSFQKKEKNRPLNIYFSIIISVVIVYSTLLELQQPHIGYFWTWELFLKSSHFIDHFPACLHYAASLVSNITHLSFKIIAEKCILSTHECRCIFIHLHVIQKLKNVAYKTCFSKQC